MGGKADGPREFGQLLRVGGPLTLAALANMAISITDVVMMGWLGPMALGAGAAISDIYSVVFYLAAGIAAAGVPILSEARGGSRMDELRPRFFEVCLATLAFGAVLVPLVWCSAGLLDRLGIESQVLPHARAYANWMALALLPMLLVRSCFAYFSALGRTRVVFLATLGAIPLNVVGNGVFMFGWFGADPLGMPGAGVSSFAVAVYLSLVLVIAVGRDGSFRRGAGGGITRRGVLECWRTGVPIGVSSLGELGVYLLSTVVMVKFGAAAVAAHALTLRLSGLLYAIPLGLSQAVTARVAYFSGAGQPDRVRHAVGTGMRTSLAVGLVYLAGLILFANSIPGLFLYTQGGRAEVIALAATLVALLAGVEFFTSIGTIAIGSLRGVKDTRAPMVYSLACLWGLGFFGGLVLGFPAGMGVVGFWIGLLSGAMAIAAMSVLRVRRTFGPWAYPASPAFAPVTGPDGWSITPVRWADRGRP